MAVIRECLSFTFFEANFIRSLMLSISMLAYKAMILSGFESARLAYKSNFTCLLPTST